jgi:uncharacterized membrane protein
MDKLSKSFVALASIGILVAIYHGYDEVTNYSAPGATICNINSFFSCGSVFSSGYTTFPPHGGLSLFVYGLIWFPLMLGLGLWFTGKRGGVNGVVMVPVLMVGNVFTIYLWYLELGVIHALCPVCVSLYVLNYLMTAVCLVIALRQDRADSGPSPLGSDSNLPE